MWSLVRGMEEGELGPCHTKQDGEMLQILRPDMLLFASPVA